ncbi:hypothetical protein SAMN05444004_104169 [Jannaschia faecimaris]|uniref:Uncharacterized protein n=1 Tax=Jannaschia faecimaris TaxID=1244108 RepID=A0A1H3P0P9_9RHOB|nr:hypothetical protein SAMN05444004_104169 [Jannaschia faecimaris]
MQISTNLGLGLRSGDLWVFAPAKWVQGNTTLGYFLVFSFPLLLSIDFA